MPTKIIGNIVTPVRLLEEGEVCFENGKITHVGSLTSNVGYDVVDCRGLYVSPGFIDVHVHGGGGSDFLDGDVNSFLIPAKAHAEHGTTTLLPTTSSGTDDDLFKFLDNFKKSRALNTEGADMPGVHLEGPYFSYGQRGAQPPQFLKNPTPEHYLKILDYCDKIIRVDCACELDGALKLGDELYRRGIVASIAHTDGIYEQALEAFEHGYTHLTHFYSGMSQLVRKNSYRFPGVIDAGYMLEDFTIEIIADGCHLPPSMLRSIYRAKGADKTCLVTDSTRGPLPGQNTMILGSLKNGTETIIEDGVAKMPDRSCFAGSIATADRLVRNMLRHADCGICDAVKMMTRTPAVIHNLRGKGVLVEGFNADIVVFDDDVNIKYTIVNGKTVYGK